MRLLVHGLAVAGEAVVRAAVARGWDVLVTDDAPTEHAVACAEQLGVELVVQPDAAWFRVALRRVDAVCPSPGVPEHHPLVVAALAAGVPLRTELDLAWEWEGERVGGRRPMVAVTGTDGKTTVTTLATEMLQASGVRAVDAGNTDLPLVAALDLDVDVFVVEATSFRLRWLTGFAPQAATWLNLAPDHLDWHGDVTSYAAAKARIWEFQGVDDVAIGWADDPIVMAALARAPARRVRFGGEGSSAEYRVESGELVTPGGALLAVAAMWRSFPHDCTNALAAAATVLEPGLAGVDGVRQALLAFRGIPHRITFVAEAEGVRFYDDSKATTPHAARTAIAAFDSVVLIAGGRNKALDLSEMADGADRVRSVVAIGDSAEDIRRAFARSCPVTVAHDMDEAVALAARAASPGDVVLLSPGCASFDWYRNYGERGDDYARAVTELVSRR